LNESYVLALTTFLQAVAGVSIITGSIFIVEALKEILIHLSPVGTWDE